MTVFTYFEPLSAGHCAYWAQMVLSAAARDSRISRVQLQTSAKLADRLAASLSIYRRFIIGTWTRPMEPCARYSNAAGRTCIFAVF